MKPTGYYHTDVPVTRALRERVERDEVNAHDVLDACEEQERQAADLRVRLGLLVARWEKTNNPSVGWLRRVLNGETPPPAGQPWAPAPVVDPLAALRQPDTMEPGVLAQVSEFMAARACPRVEVDGERRFFVPAPPVDPLAALDVHGGGPL